MTKSEIFAALVVLIVSIDASQLIRLRSGEECPTPGYFRDELDCTKFYYCPAPAITKPDEEIMSIADMAVLREIQVAGLNCPPGSIFDEAVSHCEVLPLIKTIPPECLAGPKSTRSFKHFKTGEVPEISHNH